jgi:hypothetical protein
MSRMGTRIVCCLTNEVWRCGFTLALAFVAHDIVALLTIMLQLTKGTTGQTDRGREKNQQRMTRQIPAHVADTACSS